MKGLALYIESQLSDDSKKYWDIVFEVCLKNNKILKWDDAAVNSISDYPIDAARTEYAQSHKMAGFLISKYGMNKVMNYIKSFKVKIEKTEKKTDMVKAYKENFTKIFNISWEENLLDFEKYLKTEKGEKAKVKEISR